MKNFFLFILILCSAILFSETVKLLIAYEDKEQPPYYMGNSSEVELNPGVAVEMIKLLETKIDNIEIEFVRLPWSRCLFMLENNRVDGIFNASYKQQRLNYGWYPTKKNDKYGQLDESKRITTISYYFYKREDNKIRWDGEKLYGLKGKIGAPLGYSIVDDLHKKGYKVDQAINTKNNIEKLSIGRIELAALQGVTADSIIKADSLKFSDIKRLEPPIASKSYFLMLSDNIVKNYPKLSRTIWENIEKIREDEFEKLVKKYNTN